MNVCVQFFGSLFGSRDEGYGDFPVVRSSGEPVVFQFYIISFSIFRIMIKNTGNKRDFPYRGLRLAFWAFRRSVQPLLQRRVKLGGCVFPPKKRIFHIFP